jgi:sulfatase modifying factor 1
MFNCTNWSPVILIMGALTLGSCADPPEPRITLSDGSVMIYVPGGEFDMGARESDFEGHPNPDLEFFKAERPLHRVRVSPFYLAQLEVTNAQYVQFYTAFVNTPDSTLLHPDHPAELDFQLKHINAQLIRRNEQPVVSVPWFAAVAYCNWAGGRLPTEAEWEYAARGGDGTYRKYPWGNAPPDSDFVWLANYDPPNGADMDGVGFTAPVGSFPDGVSYFGILDMAGNAQEWVQDWYSDEYYSGVDDAVDPAGPADGIYKVRRGGSYRSAAYGIRTASRAYGRPKHSTALIGFRCARDP